MKRTLLIVLIVLLVVTNAGWAYLVLDTGMALDDATSELVRQRHISQLLGALLLELPRGIGLDEAAATIRTKHPDAIVKRRGEWLEADGVALLFRGDTLVRVGPLEISDSDEP